MRNNIARPISLEKEIDAEKKKLVQLEEDLIDIIYKLKTVDPTSQKALTLQIALQVREKDIVRQRAHCKSLSNLKRKKENEQMRTKTGNFKKEVKRKVIYEEMNQEIRNIDTSLASLSGLEVSFKKDPKSSKSNITLFISHATEDKEMVARPLAKSLISRGLSVWYDEFTLTIGDSLRKSIDHGLATCTFGLIIVSSNFFSKNWTQYELNGLVTREMEGRKVILPIWHKVTKDDVMRFSPSLADKVALDTSLLTIDEIAEKIKIAVLKS